MAGTLEEEEEEEDEEKEEEVNNGVALNLPPPPPPPVLRSEICQLFIPLKPRPQRPRRPDYFPPELSPRCIKNVGNEPCVESNWVIKPCSPFRWWTRGGTVKDALRGAVNRLPEHDGRFQSKERRCRFTKIIIKKNNRISWIQELDADVLAEDDSVSTPGKGQADQLCCSNNQQMILHPRRRL